MHLCVLGGIIFLNLIDLNAIHLTAPSVVLLNESFLGLNIILKC